MNQDPQKTQNNIKLNLQNNLKDTLDSLLRTNSKFCDPNSEDVNYTMVKDSADKVDEDLIVLLISNQNLKNKFFLKIKDVYVLKINEFKFFLEENKIDNSYTQYKNRIGLTDTKKFLKDTNDVVLDFPFKDCILEGGQSTEEGIDNYYEFQNLKTKKVDGVETVTESAGYKLKQSKRKEIFYNQVLAYDEIDRLLDTKALTGWKRINKDGISPAKAIKRDESGTIRENLIIKGNNLLALHSLKKEFKGKVKLIYIDPPYNTGTDGFKYNDNFNHSTWLTFMKNRLEIARELLRDDGVIFVQCDDNEQAYLKVLMDSIFGRELSLGIICVKAKSSAGASGGGEDKKLKKNKELILSYGKTSNSQLNFVYQEKQLTDILYEKNKEGKKYEYDKIFIDYGSIEKLSEIKLGTGEIIDVFKHSDYKIQSIKEIAKIENLSEYEVYKKYYKFVFRTQDAQSSIRHKVVQATNKNGGLFSIEYAPKTGKNKNKIIKVYYFKNEMVNHLTNTTRIEKNNIIKLIVIGDLWLDIGWDGTGGEGGVVLKSGKKPEKLLQRILEMSTEIGDIVLDYHLGSGTTAAVAHKMERQYIGIEQMDYIETIAVERLKKVINGEQGGISKVVNWNGGGDFLYCELAKWNLIAKEQIEACKSYDELVGFFDELYDKYFLNYNLKIVEFCTKVINEPEFQNLTLEQQKIMFLTMLDLNQMYVNASEAEDSKYGISAEDIQLTKEFYGDKSIM